MVTALRILDRKLLRDLWKLRGPAAAIALVVACGVASFVALRSMVYHLAASQESFYAASRFGNVFAQVKRAPGTVLRDVAGIPGVKSVEARVTGDVVLDVPGLLEPASGHIVGINASRRSAIDAVSIVTGRALAPGRNDEVLLSEGFANANHLTPGDSIGAVLNGRWQWLRMVGTASSPAYVYTIRPGDLFPDDRRYGILYMDNEAAASAFGMRDAWNDLSIALVKGASERDVIRRLDGMLERFGSLGAYGRSLQLSHRFLSNEIDQNRTFATVVPVIFLGVAAFLLNLVLSRIVAEQREQVGMLKAFGVSDRTLVRHFVLFALVPVLIGAAVGCAVGIWVAGKMATLYAQYFRIPNAPFMTRVDVLLAAIAISVTAAITGAIGGLRRVLRLPAAEAMRAEAPSRYRAGVAVRLGVDRLLTPVGRMTLRAIERRPWRAGLSVLGMALAVAVVMVGNFAWDSIGYISNLQFNTAQREDVSVTFTVPRNNDALFELAHLPGVTRVEAVRSVPVRIRHVQHERQLELTGVTEHATLRRVVDDRARVITMPGEGIALSSALGELLDVRVGDTVQVELLIGDRRRQDLKVGALVNDFVGVNAYLSANAFFLLIGASEFVSGAALAVDADARDSVFARLKRTPGVTGVGAHDAMVRNFDATMSESFGVTLTTLFVFAAALSVGVVYNMARIALSERGRELASLRVLGFTRGEVARMLFGEQALLMLVAVPVGFLIGRFFSWAMIAALESDLYRLPLIISANTYELATIVLLASFAGSALLVRRRLDRVDLVGVLKTRE